MISFWTKKRGVPSYWETKSPGIESTPLHTTHNLKKNTRAKTLKTNLGIEIY
jgi:hypothetical protein